MKFRAKVLVIANRMFGTAHKKHDCDLPSWESCLKLDIFCLFFFELLPDLGLIYNLVGSWQNFKQFKEHARHPFFVGHTGRGEAAYCGYMSGTLYFCMVVTLVQVWVEYKYSRLEWHTNEGVSFHHQVQKLEDIMSRQNIYPYFNWNQYWAFKFAYSITHEKPTARDPGVDVGIYHRRSHLGEDNHGRRTYLLYMFLWECVVLLWWLQASAEPENSFNSVADTFSLLRIVFLISAPIMLGVTVVGVSFKVKKETPNILKATYWFFLLLFAAMLIGLFAPAMLSANDEADESQNVEFEPLMTYVNGSTGPDRWTLPSAWNGDLRTIYPEEDQRTKVHIQKYPICRMTWGSEDAPLTALDLAALARISYSPAATLQECDSVISGLLKESFGYRDVTVVNCTVYDSIPRWFSVKFKGHGRDGKDTIVIAIKGTSTVADAYLDVDLFTFIKALQLFSFLVPVVSLMPTDLLQWLTLMIKDYSGAGGPQERKLWEQLVSEAKNLKKIYSDADFVVTGHSIGGALAEIVAGQTGIAALQFSGPGTHYTERFFNNTEEEMQRDVISVIPDNDAVPRVDLHDAVRAPVQCFNKSGEQADPLTCHLLTKTGCEVWRVCGDKYQRDFNRSCSQYIATDELGTRYKDKFTIFR